MIFYPTLRALERYLTLKIQLSLEQHWFELRKPTLCGFFPINTCIVFNLQLGVCRHGLPLYILICAILYRKLEHPQILLSAGVLEPIFHRYQGIT